MIKIRRIFIFDTKNIPQPLENILPRTGALVTQSIHILALMCELCNFYPTSCNVLHSFAIYLCITSYGHGFSCKYSMNTFNNIYSAIKAHCGDASTTEDKKCFKKVCRQANVPPRKIGSYLDSLHNLGFIDYSPSKNVIRLTPLGQQQERLLDYKENTLTDASWRKDAK